MCIDQCSVLDSSPRLEYQWLLCSALSSPQLPFCYKSRITLSYLTVFGCLTLWEIWQCGTFDNFAHLTVTGWRGIQPTGLVFLSGNGITCDNFVIVNVLIRLASSNFPFMSRKHEHLIGKNTWMGFGGSSSFIIVYYNFKCWTTLIVAYFLSFNSHKMIGWWYVETTPITGRYLASRQNSSPEIAAIKYIAASPAPEIGLRKPQVCWRQLVMLYERQNTTVVSFFRRPNM